VRILLVNWAKIYKGTDEGGGVNGYVQSLAIELTKLGHQIISLTSGRDYAPPSNAAHTTAPHTIGPVQLRREPDWLGVHIYSIVNSPVVAPSLAQFNDPIAEIAAADLERVFAELVRGLRIDIAHFHNLEGLTAGCINAAQEAGAVVLASLHNYHSICPQVYLMQNHMHPCRDFGMGRACEKCIDVPDPGVEKQRLVQATIDRAATRLSEQIRLQESGPDKPTADARAAYIQARRNLRHELNWPLRLARAARAFTNARRSLRSITGSANINNTYSDPAAALTSPPPELGLEGVPVQLPITIKNTPKAPPNNPPPTHPTGTIADTRGQTAALLAEASAKHFQIDLAAPHRQPLLNTVLPEPQPADSDDVSIPPYARRRAAMIRALNSCHRVLAVSNTVRDIFVSKGVHTSRIDVMHIGTKAARLAELNAELLDPPPPFSDDDQSIAHTRPVRLLFIGMNNYYKGLGMLAESLMLLSPTELGRFELTIAARDVHTIEHVFRRIEPRLARLSIHGSYTPNDIPWLCSQKDIGIVSSVWWDNAPQTVFEYQSCGLPVLGAALGGIPDFVIDQHNGLLFRGNDRQDLARQLRTLAHNPAILNTLRANVTPPKRIEHHARELATLYADLRNDHADPPSPTELAAPLPTNQPTNQPTDQPTSLPATRV